MNGDVVVSVVVLVYNAEQYLSKCIESIINQTYQSMDIVLVDDGSTDGSSQICDSFAGRDSRIRVIHKPNGGLVSAWQAGLLATNTHTEFVVFIDSDDWIEENHIAYMVKEQQKTDADIVVVRMKQAYKDKEVYIDFVAEPKFYSKGCMETELYPVLINAGGFEHRGVPVSRCSKLIRKTLLVNNLKYSVKNATYEEDLNIMVPVFLDMKSISLLMCDDAAYCYRMNENSMLHAYDKNMIASIRRIYPSIYQACKDKEKLCFENQINMEYLTAIVRACTNELGNPSGLRAGLLQVRQLSQDSEIKRVLQNDAYTSFPLRFKIVVSLMRNSNRFWSGILFYLLGLAKKCSRGTKNAKNILKKIIT